MALSEKVAESLRQNIRSGSWPQGMRIPTVVSLAEDFGVSHDTICGSLTILKAERLITIKQGSRGWVGAAPGKAAHEPGPILAWQRTRTLIDQEIRSGHYSMAGRLPPAGTMQQRYGVCGATLRKALSALVEEKAIVYERRSYRLSRPRTRNRRSAVALLVENEQVGEISAANLSAFKFIDAVEMACRRSSMEIRIIHCNPHRHPDILDEVRRQIDKDDTIVGFVWSLWFSALPSLSRRVFDVVNYLAHLKKPIAIFDVSQTLIMPLPWSAMKSISVLRTSNERAGQAVARHLLNLGHSKVAFLSHCLNEQWARERLAGISGQFEKAGCRGGVTAIGSKEVRGWWQLLYSLFEGSPQEFAALFRPYHSDESSKDRMTSYIEARKMNPFKERRSQAQAMVAAGIRLMESMPSQNIDREYYGTMFENLLYHSGHRLVAPFMATYFEMALADKSITAWVAADDVTAHAAYCFLSQKQIRVPDNVSLIGFDNYLPFVFATRITSYDFDLSAVAHQSLSFVVQPAPRSSRQEPQITEVDGALMERRSTALASVR